MAQNASPMVLLSDSDVLTSTTDVDVDSLQPSSTASSLVSRSAPQSPVHGRPRAGSNPSARELLQTQPASAGRRRSSNSLSVSERRRSNSLTRQLVDSVPLSSGPLFDGQPKQNAAEPQRPPNTRHSYTPQKAVSKPRSLTQLEGEPPAVVAPAMLPSLSTSPADNQRMQDDLVEGRQVYEDFLHSVSCYDTMPYSSKIVVFDVELKVKKAFFALVQNGIRSAPLWDSKRQQFIGMVTVTDFISILKEYYVSPGVEMAQLEEHRIKSWRKVCKKRPDVLVCVDPSVSLLTAVRLLLEEKIHRLPVIDSLTGNAMAIMTHKRILQFIHANVHRTQRPAMLSLTLEQLNIGTYSNIATVAPEDPIITALNIFVSKRISALPVVNRDGLVIDIYAKHDVINLAREGTYQDLDVTVVEALKHRQQGFEGVRTCTMQDSLGKIIDRVIDANVHRLVVTDASRKLVGILSLSDILHFLIG
eukprot:TRINITY_DN7132_c0_g1_i1.p1 TRINITY_DN7132_c0_g1~~TRINITY_DN7132_c0_g1_i1.p1  ORF type:complete len:474 (+),score=95.86 TRINITY_DN7132_c0_g1_i1:196-1617(+)